MANVPPNKEPKTMGQEFPAQEFLLDNSHIIFEFLSGADMSNFCVAALGPAQSRDKVVLFMKRFVEISTVRCDKLLSKMEHAENLHEYWCLQAPVFAKKNFEKLPVHDVSFLMRVISSWCILLHYCEAGWEGLANRLRGGEDGREICRPIGVGKLGEASTPVILSTSIWSKELCYVAEKWLAPELHDVESHFFEEAPNVPISRVGIMSWGNGEYLKEKNEEFDIFGGLLVCHDCREGTLFWLPRASCEMYADIRQNLALSEQTRWLLNGTEWDNDMLCYWELRDDITVTLPHNYDDDLMDSIITMVRTCKEI